MGRRVVGGPDLAASAPTASSWPEGSDPHAQLREDVPSGPERGSVAVDAERLARVAAALTVVDGASPIDALLELCVEMLDVSGASIAVIGDGQHLGSLATTSGGSADVVDELQFSMGEGPCISADRSLGPVLEPDLETAIGIWPAFGPAALSHGVAAVFAFPLRVGAIHLGVLTLYRSEVGDLEPSTLTDAVVFSRVATHLLLALEGDLAPGALPRRLAEIIDERSVVHQATGMVAVQLEVDVRTALGRLRAFAWSHDRPLDEVADDVVSRRFRFEDP